MEFPAFWYSEFANNCKTIRAIEGKAKYSRSREECKKKNLCHKYVEGTIGDTLKQFRAKSFLFFPRKTVFAKKKINSLLAWGSQNKILWRFQVNNNPHCFRKIFIIHMSTDTFLIRAARNLYGIIFNFCCPEFLHNLFKKFQVNSSAITLQNSLLEKKENKFFYC